MATDSGWTRNQRACLFVSSMYPDTAMHPAKNVMCQTNVNNTAKPLYWQKICTDRNGLMIPIQNETISVTDVIVIETAASDIIKPIRSGTDSFGDVRRHAASITNVSSIPIPKART